MCSSDLTNCASLHLLDTAIAPRWVTNCASLRLPGTAIATRWVTNCASLYLPDTFGLTLLDLELANAVVPCEIVK